MTLAIIAVLALALFGLAFSTKRRFGILGLGLSAGVLLAQNATGYTANFLQQNQVSVTPFSYQGAAVILLTLLPSLLLLINGPTYGEKKTAFVGAIAFALLGTILILGPITAVLPITEPGIKGSLGFIANWQNVIVIAAIVIAIIDTIMLHGPKNAFKKHDKH